MVRLANGTFVSFSYYAASGPYAVGVPRFRRLEMAVTSCAGANSFFKTDTVGHASRRPLISGRARHVCIFCLLMGWSGCDPAPAASDPYAGHQTQGARTLCGAHRAGPRDATSQKISRVGRSAKARRSTTPIIIPGTREASPLACDPSRPGAHDAFPVTQKCSSGARRLVFGRHRTAPLFPCCCLPRLRRRQPCQPVLGNEQLRAHLS